MAKIVQEFANLQKCVMAFTYRDGSVAIECSYYSNDEDNATLFHKLEISPEGAKVLRDMLVRATEQRNEADTGGQKCPRCVDGVYAHDMSGVPIICIHCNGKGHF